MSISSQPRLLTQNDVEQSFNLLNDVATEMHEQGHDTYIHSRTRKQLNEILTNKKNKIAGIFTLDKNGQELRLVSQMGYFGVNNNSKRDLTDGTLPNFLANNIPNEEISFIGSLCVAKDFRGQGLSQKMDSFLENKSQRRFSVVMVDTTNYKSFGHFLDTGFYLTQQTFDPEDNGKILYFVKDLQTTFLDIEPHIEISIKSPSYLKDMAYLLDTGNIGCGFNKETKSIAFTKRSDITEHFGTTPIIDARPKINTPNIINPIRLEPRYA